MNNFLYVFLSFYTFIFKPVPNIFYPPIFNEFEYIFYLYDFNNNMIWQKFGKLRTP